MTFSVRDQCANVVVDRKGKGTMLDIGSDGRDVVAMGAELILEKPFTWIASRRCNTIRLMDIVIMIHQRTRLGVLLFCHVDDYKKGRGYTV